MDKVNHSRESAEDVLMELVHRVLHRYRAGQHAELRAGGSDLAPMETKVLGQIGRQPGLTLSDMVRHSGRDKAQLARLVKSLRERGLLSTEVDPADRRNVRLAVTAEGRDLLQRLQRRGRRLALRAVTGLAADDVEQLTALLRRVYDNLGPEGE